MDILKALFNLALTATGILLIFKGEVTNGLLLLILAELSYLSSKK